MGQAKRELLRDAIVGYARQHPDASDTATGILGWWIPSTGFEDAAPMLDEVLADLVAEGVLHDTALPDGSVLYSVIGDLHTTANDKPPKNGSN